MLRRRRRFPGAHSFVLCLLAFASLAQAAVSSADLIEYLGGTVTGQTMSTFAYDLTMLANSTHVLVHMSYPVAMSECGWMALGIGTTMTDADIIMVWGNADNSWTLSHRTADNTVEPKLTDSTAPKDTSTDATGSVGVVASLSSSTQADSPTVVTFVRPLKAPTGYVTTAKVKDVAQVINTAVIYAVGPTNPGSSDPGATCAQHDLDKMGQTYVDLSASFTADAAAITAPLTEMAGGGSSPTTGGGDETPITTAVGATPTGTNGTGTTTTKAGTGTGTGGGVTGIGTGTQTGTAGGAVATSMSTSTSDTASGLSYSTVIQIHAVCGAVAWLLAAPAGVLIARLGRSCLFFPWHWGAQVFFTTVLTLSAVGLAFWASSLQGTSAPWDAHKILGLVIAVLVCAQDGVGLWIHLAGLAASKAEKAKGRAARNWFHIGVGITLLVCGFVQVRLGITKLGLTQPVFVYGYWVPVVLFAVVYLISAAISIAHPPKPPPPSKPAHSHHHKHNKHLHRHHHHIKPRWRSRRSREHHSREHHSHPSHHRRRRSSSLSDNDSGSDSGGGDGGSSGTESLLGSSSGSSSAGSSSPGSSDSEKTHKRKKWSD